MSRSDKRGATCLRLPQSFYSFAMTYYTVVPSLSGKVAAWPAEEVEKTYEKEQIYELRR